MDDRLNSEEHRAQLAERRGHPHGRHIKEDDGRRDPDNHLGSDLENRLLQLEMANHSQDAVPVMPKPRFDSTINTGHVLTMLTIIIGLLTLAFSGYGLYKDQQATMNDKFNSIQATILRMQDSLDEDHRTIQRNKAESDDRSKHWIEVIEAGVRANQQQDERLSNMSKLLTDTITTVNDLSRTTATIDKGFGILQDRLARGDLPTPRGR